MPTSQAVLNYRSSVFGNTAAIQAALVAVPLPQDILTMFGLLVKSDVSAAAVRTVTLGLVPTVGATATAVLEAGVPPGGSGVIGVTITGAGSGYAAPPQVVFSGGGGGSGAAARSSLDLASVTLVGGGSLYAAPVVTLEGGLPPSGGVPAVVTATVVLGVITGFVVVSPGSGYIGIPKVVITDSAGSGASGTAVMQVGAIEVLNPGRGYPVVPTVTLVPLFKTYAPDGPGQAPFLANLFSTGIQKGAFAQVLADAPVIT